MMIKFTERCTMGCSHCLNDAKADGKDMPFDVLLDTLDFLKEHNLGRSHLIITGGEPTEHPAFDLFMNRIIDFHKQTNHFTVVTVTTNGENVQNDPERFKGYVKKANDAGFHLLFQVSADTRYYPRRINVTKRIFREEGFVLVDNCIRAMYPQGRALTNNYPWVAKCSKCFNVRSISHQIPEGSTLADIESHLTRNQKFCTPHIGIYGTIKLGESDLCTPCACIYDDMPTIMKKIRTFQCHKCDHVNKNLPQLFKALLNG